MIACGSASRNILGPPKIKNQHGAVVESGVVKCPVGFGVVKHKDVVGPVVLDLEKREFEVSDAKKL